MWLIAAFVAGPSGAAPTQADTPLPIGASIERALRLDGKQVALPAGNWIVAADGASEWNDPSLGAFGYLRTVILFHVIGSRVDAVLEVNANLLPTTDGWGTAVDCGRADLILAIIRYRAGWDGSCYFVTHTLLSDGSTRVWRAARGYATSRGWSLSPVSLTAGFRAADRADVLDIRYHFAPETNGISGETVTLWRDSHWMAARLDNDPRRYAFAHAVSDWAVRYSPLVEVGLKNRPPPDAPIALPRASDAGPAENPIARRLTELELLLQAGVITAEDQAEQARMLREQGSGSSSTAPDLSAITAVKAVSYRIIVSISHLFVDYYWTGNLVAAGALEVLQITINSAKFYFHELAWAKYMGLPRSDAARIIDFKYIGVDL
jgi:uncharacterized membrane protein